MADVNAGKLTFDVSADLKKLDAALKQAKAKLNEVDKPLEVEVDVDVETNEAEQALSQTKSKMLDLGQGAEKAQAKIGKVLGVLAGLIAVVQIVGGVGKALRDLGRDAAGVGGEAELAVSTFRRFSESIPVFGAIGIALEDIAMGLGIVDDAVLAVERRLARAEEAAKRFQQALTGERAVEDFKRQLMELQGATELQILEAGLDPVVDALDDQITTVKDTLREAEDELSRLRAAGAGFGDADPDIERSFDEQLAVIKQLKADLQELSQLRPQILNEREAVLRGQELEEQQAKRFAQAQEQVKIEEEALAKRLELIDEEEAKTTARLKAEADMRESARKLQKELAEEELKAAKQLLQIRGQDVKTLEKRRDLAEKELKAIQDQRKSTRERLGGTESVDSVIGSFVTGRTFGASAKSQTDPEKQQERELRELNKKISTTNEILRTIQERGGLTGALT